MGGYDDLILSDDPALYWKLDETSGTVVNDSSGNARHGKLYTGQVVSGSGISLNQPSLIKDGDPSMRINGLWSGSPLVQQRPGTGLRADAYAPYQAGSKRSFEVWLRKEDEASFATIFSAAGDDKPATTLTGAHGPFPVGTITVGSTAGFPASGDDLNIVGITGSISYSSKNATQFLGCVGGSGSAINGAAVTYGVTANHPTWEMGANGMMRYYADVNRYPAGFVGFVDWGSANTGHPASIFRPYQPMHIVCTFDDSSGVAEFWVNGISMGKQGPYGYLSGTWPMAYSELGCDVFQFGWRGDVNLFPNPGNTEVYGGYAQKLAIYERILTESEIVAHARAGSGATPIVVTTHDGATSTALSPTGGSRGAAGIWLAGEENEGLLPITQYDEEYTESAFSEGAMRTRSRPTNGVGSGKVYVAGATEDEFAAYLDEWQMLVEDMRRDGGTIQYTRPDSSTPVTYDVISFKITEVPYDGRFMAAYVAAFAFEFTCRPYGRLSDVDADLAINDRFSSSDVSLLRGDWLFDAGSGSAIVFGDRLVMWPTTAEKRMYRGATKYENSTTWFQFVTGASVASGSVAAMAKRLDASNYLMACVNANGVSSTLEIVKCDATVLTALSSSAAFVLNPNRMYWVELVVNGNGLTANLYAEGVNSTPEPDYYPDVDPIATVSYTLAGANATKYGTGVWGNNGLRIIPQATDWAGVSWRTAGQRVRSTRPIADFDVENVPGHVDALGDLTIVEKSSKSRHHLEVGLTNVYDLDRDAPVLIDSDQFVVSGYSGAQSDGTAYSSYGLSAAYDPLATTNIYVTAATNSMKSVAVCGLGDWGHVGKHRVRARVAFGNLSTTDTCKVRLAWRIGDGPLQSNRWIEIPGSTSWKEIDLGVIDIPEATLGTQRWTGQIDAIATLSNAGRVFVDYVEVVPADRYVKSSYTYDPTAAARAITALDDFSGAAGVLTGDTAPTGGVWTAVANSDTNDFQNGLGGVTGLTRITSGADTGTIATGFTGRYLYAASSTATDILASLDARGLASAGGDFWGIVFHRSAATTFGAVKVWNIGGTRAVILLYKVVTGTVTLVGAAVVDAQMILNWWRLQVATDGSGNVFVYFQPQASEPILRLVGTDSAFATAGAVASGTQGILQENTAATVSWWELDNFNVVTPVYDAALFSGRTARIRARDALREDSFGTYWGQLPNYVGARLLVPPAGAAGNASKLAAKARRLNVDAVQDEAIADEIELGLTLTPRVLLL